MTDKNMKIALSSDVHSASRGQGIGKKQHRLASNKKQTPERTGVCSTVISLKN
jgi:hypothetical protein